MADNETAVAEVDAAKSEEPKLKLQVDVSPVGPCKKHVRVKIARASLDEVEGVVISQFSGDAQVPGFRVGHVPLALVKKRFKKELGEQIKQRVLMQSLEQLADEQDLDPSTSRSSTWMPSISPMRAISSTNSTSKSGLSSICRSTRD